MKDKKLFTPGPLNTSDSIKSAMLRDLGSRDNDFISIVNNVRNKLLELVNLRKGDYESILMQGSGTFGIESVISSTVPIDGKLLVIINGAYGKRIKNISHRLGIETIDLIYQENEIPDLNKIEEILNTDNEITNVAVVHCETTSGIINPIDEIGKIVKKYNVEYIVDAMSSFGAYQMDFISSGIDYLISSSNKCIEGVPGFSFIIAKTESLKKKKNFSISTSLDLYDQWIAIEGNGQFRFTPPTHSILAFNQALIELEDEGGINGRANRYKLNHEYLVNGMRKLGFSEYVESANQGYIITSFYYPISSNFIFEKFYERLSEKGFVIYPGKLSEVNCFRIGNIGRIFINDIENLLNAIYEVKYELNF
ncbi:MAG: 2-aminoethylphosphonate--pyruvate transaminase [Ignavibacteriae bacterium]|nr:2-aminoethylphosphonate--pyruvate transaminase [Ignavibacteriota bacterium]